MDEAYRVEFIVKSFAVTEDIVKSVVNNELIDAVDAVTE